MTALRELVAKRNVRSILFRFSRATAANVFRSSVALQILRALKIHGFRLGYIGEQWTDKLSKRDSEIGSTFDFVQYGKERTILVTEQGIRDNDASEFRKMATAVINISANAPDQPAQQLTKLTRDLLSFDNCLDMSGRCFGPYRVQFSQIFYESSLSFALVNLKPIVPACWQNA
uniref:Uncharacterized protein n=1 Tax=Globisporangium ultimum (strain ATCC 200006 / CBS 805.95 / DAOM BR144) TaxID=431595 RepID=K3WPI2_GLOUD